MSERARKQTACFKMITNYLVGKFVLFVDHTNLERISHKLIQSWFTSTELVNIISLQPLVPLRAEPISLPSVFSESQPDKFLYLPLAEMCQTYNISEVFQLIHRHKTKQTIKQMFGWASVKNIEAEFLIPYLEYLANVVVTIKDSVNLSIVTRKSSGSVTKKLFQYQYRDGDFQVKEVKQEIVTKTAEPTIEPESLTTFKINVDEEEMVARNALKLPYERSSDNQKAESKIIYHPDSDDDIDEEDPDDDLDI
ncbi:hypothetical protein Bhyg_06801 [Pseudolycoriella hygida]|uniref:Elongator complex protein 5 n=1 Tax=Pseudolycoriella hygida TaxID=35572 RepID=A0A9Q0N2Y4_9DIPT|nr:hypothetical protein Bhyg_06801 [Pseudolycoriella hygida]